MQRILLLALLVKLVTNVYGEPPDTLVLGYNVAPPFVTEEDQSLEGPSVWLWEQMAEDLGMAYKYVPMTLDTLLNALETGKIDVGLSPLTITADRSEVIDFTSPYYITHSSILQKDVTALKKSLAFLKSFFSLNFFRALGALAMVILIFGFLVWLFERKNNEKEFGSGIKGLWNGFWWSAVTMTTVGYGDKSPKTPGGRLVALIWMFTAIIIISGFTAGIASSLTMNSMGDSHDGIMDYKEVKIGTITNSGTEEWLKNNFFTEKTSYSNLDDMLAALKNGDIEAIAYDRPILNSLSHVDSLSDYTVVDIAFNPQFYAMGMNRNLPEEVKRNINTSVLKMIESMEWKVVRSEFGLD